MKKVTDIDIDFADRDEALKHIAHTAASLVKDKQLKRHNVGVYLHEVPTDPITGLCSIPYEQAEANGFFKMDFLNLSIYKDVRDEAHLQALMSKPPIWALLEDQIVVEDLFQLHNHYNIVSKMKPTSVEQLAMVLAMIRPAKQYLIGKSWSEIEAEIWVDDGNDAYRFKKSHAISYALVIVVQLNLMVEKVTSAS